GFGFGGPFILDVHSSEHKRAGAVFGQIEEELGHGVVMTFGSRLSRDDKNFEMLKRDYAGVPGNTITDRVSYANLYPGVYIEGIGGNVNFTRTGPPLPLSTQCNLIPDTLLPPAGDLTHRADNLVDARIGLTWHAAE